MRNHVDCLSAVGYTIEVGLSNGAEGDRAVYSCKERMVFAGINVAARQDLSTTLADEHLTSAYGIPVSTLYAQIFWV